jgi:hypothetical protein
MPSSTNTHRAFVRTRYCRLSHARALILAGTDESNVVDAWVAQHLHLHMARPSNNSRDTTSSRGGQRGVGASVGVGTAQDQEEAESDEGDAFAPLRSRFSPGKRVTQPASP